MSAAANIGERIGGLPSGRDEHWQYAPLRPLRALRDWRATPVPAVGATAGLQPFNTTGFDQLVFVDGHLAGGALASRVRQMAAVASPAAADPAAMADPDLRLSEAPAAAGLPALVLDVTGSQRIELCFINSGTAGVAYPRLWLQVAANAELALLERHAGRLAPSALLCSDFRLQLGAGSQVTHYRLHGLGPDSLCFDQLQARLEADSRYTVQHIAANGGLSRTTAVIELAGRGASAEWHTAANLQASQRADLLLRIQHRAPATESLSRFRGIAAGQARASCAADVLVAASARGARVRQSLKGLNDGAGAGVNLRPRLTIDTDDIQAQHGATTGQLDAQLLFYLRSRGLDLETATRLLKWAFLGDVLGGISDPVVRQAAESLTAGGLAP